MASGALVHCAAGKGATDKHTRCHPTCRCSGRKTKVFGTTISHFSHMHRSVLRPRRRWPKGYRGRRGTNYQTPSSNRPAGMTAVPAVAAGGPPVGCRGPPGAVGPIAGGTAGVPPVATGGGWCLGKGWLSGGRRGVGGGRRWGTPWAAGWVGKTTQSITDHANSGHNTVLHNAPNDLTYGKIHPAGSPALKIDPGRHP